MNNKEAYQSLQNELEQIEQKTGLYLADPCVDRENVDRNIEPETEDFYECLIRCAKSAAGSRAEEHGFDINQLIGRVIY